MIIAASLSRKILIALVILLILSFVGITSALTFYTQLVPNLVYPGWQVWRLITYPIGVSLVGTIIGLITFSIPGEELEQILGLRQYALLLVMMTLCAGLMHTALFFEGGIPMRGVANLALFVLVGYVYLFPQSEIQLIFFRMRSWVLLAVLAAIVLGVAIAEAQEIRDLLFFLRDGGFGLILGGAYFHARFQKYPFLLRPIRSVERMTVRFSASGRKPVPAPRRATTQQPVRVRIPFQRPAAREVSDEERLNIILDKINEKSYNSLTEDEKKFLRDYSGRL